jgi:uncharacterized protein YggT (Ycf19 family)
VSFATVDRTPATDDARVRVVARIAQVVNYVFCVGYGLLALRFLLHLLGARSENPFVRFIVAITDPFFSPFRDIVRSFRFASGHTVVLPLVVAGVVYGLLHWAVIGLLRVVAHRKTV